MKKVNGIKSKQMLMWVPISEMSIEEKNPDKIVFKTPLGIGKSFPITSFMTNQEKEKYIQSQNNNAKLII